MKADSRILDGQLIALGEFQLDAQGEATQWHQLAVEGKWNGHWMGAFILTPTMFKQMVHAFDNSAIETVVDYEHNSVFGSSDTAPAAGWINQLQERRDSETNQAQLWGQVKWTARATAMIKANEKKYLSPTINFNSRDRHTGKPAGAKLHSVALTNTPFLHELPELRLNSLRAALLGQHQPEADPMDEKQFKALCKALGLSETSTPEQLLVKCAALMASGDQVKPLAAELKSIGDLLGLTGDQNILEAVTALNAKAAIADDVDVVAMQAQLSVLTEQNANNSAEQLVLAQQRLGKCGAKGTKSWDACLQYAKDNPKAFGTFMEGVKEGSVSPVIESTLPAGAEGRATAAGSEVENSKEFKTYAAQLGLSDEDIAEAKKAI